MVERVRRAGTHAFLGRPGSLLALPAVSELDVTRDRPGSTQTTLGGRRVYFSTPRVRRGWTVNMDGQRPQEAGMLDQLLESDPGPFLWVSNHAQVTNVLTPEQAALTEGMTGGFTAAGILTASGLSQASFAPTATGGTVSFGPAPCVPALPVTGSIFAVAPGTVVMTLNWLDATGALLATTPAVQHDVQSSRRTAITAWPVDGAAFVRLDVTGMPRGALPCISWTDELLEWSSGQGCTSSVVQSWGGDVRAAFAHRGGTRTRTIGFEVQEVD